MNTATEAQIWNGGAQIFKWGAGHSVPRCRRPWKFTGSFQ